MNTEMINIELTVMPLQLAMSERKDFKITIAATNQGNEVIDPELRRASLYVNGKWSKVWSLAIGNGWREAKWTALPHGETVSMTWSSMGESLFDEPGEFELVLKLDDTELSSVNVSVLA